MWVIELAVAHGVFASMVCHVRGIMQRGAAACPASEHAAPIHTPHPQLWHNTRRNHVAFLAHTTVCGQVCRGNMVGARGQHTIIATSSS